MTSPRFETFEHMTHTAYSWLADVARGLGTDDRRMAYRALRAWLHTLRDRLTVDDAAQFAAQLPELVRGVYFEGWRPATVPVKFGANEYVERFAREARISQSDVPSHAAAVAGALRRHLSPGQLDSALAQLPGPVGDLAAGTTGQPAPAQPVDPPDDGAAQDRLSRIEDQINTLTEAVRVLARGLETAGQADQHRTMRAAKLAQDMLIMVREPV